MKIASFNANSIRARMPVLIKWIEKENPDVLCIQETKARDSDFPLKGIEATGYSVIFRGEKSYNGVAILSKFPIERAFYGFDGQGDDEGSRLIVAWIKGVTIVNTYVPQGADPSSDKFQYKLNWFDRLLDFFQKNFDRNKSLVWSGDFNVAPDPIDVHDPKRLFGHVGFHPDEHKALKRVMDWGFVDVFRKHKKEAGEYTFWDYRVKNSVERGLGWRVDHIWATGAMAKKSVAAWIDVEPRLWEKPSDHTFIVAEFK